MVVAIKTYTGEFHREGDSWVAEVKEVPQAHTFGRTLLKTQTYLREALALVLDVDEDSFELLTNVRIDRKLDGLVSDANVKRASANDVAQKAQAATATAAVALIQSGLSLRDAATALGLSFQRVNQIINDAAPKTRSVLTAKQVSPTPKRRQRAS